MSSAGLIASFLLAPTMTALLVVRVLQHRSRQSGLSARDAAQRYSRWLLIPWLVYGLNILAAATLLSSSASPLASIVHTPWGAAIGFGIGLLPVLFIALVVRSWAGSLGHPAGAVHVSVEVRAWMAQAACALVLLGCVLALLTYAGPVAAVVGAVVLAGLQLMAYQDVFRWIWRTTPLPDDEHGRRIRGMLGRTGTAVRRILVIPSTNGGANAFVSGVFQGRRCLFVAERLLRDLPPDEVEAVVAHEIGHFVHRHVARVGIAALATAFGASLVLMGTIAAIMGGASDQIRRPLFALAGAATVLATLYVTRRMLRRFEFEADEYAARILGSPRSMASALQTLARANWLAEDRLHAGAFASHPTIRRRIEHLSALS